MHMNQSLLVIPHITHRGDLRLHDAAFGQRRAHAQAVDHLGRDGDGARVVGVAGALVRIDRHQIHAHGRFAGFVAPVIRVHGRHPVQRFIFFCLLAGGGRGRLHGQPSQVMTRRRRACQREDEQCVIDNAAFFHGLASQALPSPGGRRK